MSVFIKFVLKTIGRRFAPAFVLATVIAAAELSAQERTYSVVTTNRAVANPTKQTFVFESSGVFISTEFDGARLNEVTEIAAGEFSATIKPENSPINDAAWYAFKIWSKSNHTVQLSLNYEGGQHRYHPRISKDRLKWQPLGGDAYKANGKTNAVLHLKIGPKPLFVAGQELFTHGDFDQWIARMDRRKFINRAAIGTSTAGRAIWKMEIGGGKKETEYVFILGRQHPPEVTGTFALLSFVETLSADTKLAKAFRKRFKTVVVPIVNPDGVAEGHWRHNLGGVDLNRDWGQFNQQETRVVRDELQRTASEGGGKVRFAIDFHSTRYDVFYPVYAESREGEQLAADAEANNALMREWLGELGRRMPDYNVRLDPSRVRPDSATLVSTAWMTQTFNTPAVTYEVGDQTDRALIRKVAEQSATALMELLLRNW